MSQYRKWGGPAIKGGDGVDVAMCTFCGEPMRPGQNGLVSDAGIFAHTECQRAQKTSDGGDVTDYTLSPLDEFVATLHKLKAYHESFFDEGEDDDWHEASAGVFGYCIRELRGVRERIKARVERELDRADGQG